MDALRPELDGVEVMTILGLKPGREVGEAMRYLLEVRLDEGLLGHDVVTERLQAWWQAR